MNYYPFIILISLFVVALARGDETRFDIASGNFVCMNSEQMVNGGDMHVVKLERGSNSNFTITYNRIPGGANPPPSDPKTFQATGFMGVQNGEVTFSGGKYAVRRIAGCEDVISRLWMSGAKPIDFSCYTPPQPTPVPAPPDEGVQQ